MKTRPNSPADIFIALTATVIWSTTGIIIGYLIKPYFLPSLVVAFWRDLFVSFGMTVGLLVFSRAHFSTCPQSLGIYGFVWTHARDIQFHVDFLGAI